MAAAEGATVDQGFQMVIAELYVSRALSYVLEGTITWDGERVQALPPTSQTIHSIMREGYRLNIDEAYSPSDGEAFVRNLPRMYHGTMMYASLLHGRDAEPIPPVRPDE